MFVDTRLTFLTAGAAFGNAVTNSPRGNIFDRAGGMNDPITAPAGTLPFNVMTNLGDGKSPMWMVIEVTTNYDGTTTAFNLATDADSAFGSPTVIATTGPIAAASLTVATATNYGAGIFIVQLPETHTYERYVGLTITTTGAGTAGAVNAFLTNDISRMSRNAAADNSYKNNQNAKRTGE